MLAEHRVGVHAARSNTLGERVEDVFLLDGAVLSDNRLQIRVESEGNHAPRRCLSQRHSISVLDDHGPNEYRRGLYTWWQRTFLHPSLLAFDAPTREECTVQRARSNTPLQALVLLNDPTYVEAARGFAERMIREGGKDVESRIDRGYRLALSRTARPAEVKLLAGLYRRHLDEFRADEAGARASLHVGDRPVPSDISVPELAAWNSVARVILNLHETVMRN